MGEGVWQMNDSAVASSERPGRLFSPTLSLVGFGVLLGWHFIILYQPLPLAEGFAPSEFLLARQVILNASLGLAFALGGRLLSNLPQGVTARSSAVAYAAIAVGTVGNIALVAGSALNMAWIMVAVVLIGAAEAVLTLLWLRFYSETSENYSGQSLGASAIIAALICFFSHYLAFEASALVLIALPVLSGTLLVTAARGIPLRKNDPLGAGVPDWESARRPYAKTTAQLMAMALFFGMAQGCHSSSKTLLGIADPPTILGAALAGAVIFALYARSTLLPNLSPIVNTATLLFLGGMMALPFCAGFLSQVAAVLIMTGFIFYFVLTLIFVIDLVRTFDLNLTRALGANQALEYAMFAIGVISGSALWSAYENSPVLPFLISYAAIFVLIVITLFFTTERPPWEADRYKPRSLETSCGPLAEESSEECLEPEESASDVLCRRFCLTPREAEVFALLSKGRNAEFIQNALFISNHTVKTHIYNIYRKMGIHSLQELLDLLDAEEDARSEGRRARALGDETR